MKSFLLYYWKLVLRENKWEKLQFGKKHIDSIWPIQILFFQRVSSMNNSRFKAAATLAIPATLTTRYQCHVLSCDPDKKEVFSLRKVIGLFTLSSPRHLLKEFQFPFFRKSECLHFLFCNWEHHCTNIRARCAEKEVRTRHMLFWGNLATKAFFLCFFSMTLRLLFFASSNRDT